VLEEVSSPDPALEEALAKFGRPKIFNTDQGSQFTSAAFTGALADRTPMAVWRDAIAGARAVDMMDNAPASPTCPQPQQQTQPPAA
jgi:transposase InsO family protein